MQSNRYSCTVLIKLFLGILSINIQIKLHEKRHSKSRVVLYGQTDGRTDMAGYVQYSIFLCWKACMKMVETRRDL